MTDNFIELSEDEFDDLYPLVRNPLNPTASWSFGDGPGCLFETYGEELEFVKRQDPLTVWTLVDEHRWNSSQHRSRIVRRCS